MKPHAKFFLLGARCLGYLEGLMWVFWSRICKAGHCSVFGFCFCLALSHGLQFSELCFPLLAFAYILSSLWKPYGLRGSLICLSTHPCAGLLGPKPPVFRPFGFRRPGPFVSGLMQRKEKSGFRGLESEVKPLLCHLAAVR